ncbi:hypothetical protein BGZ73_005020 [Actinomortierella ambigua]|nr:hypothetical protein BGZ73_005020 [Actinomortierella ambigua]
MEQQGGRTRFDCGQTDPAATGHAQSHWTLAGTSSSSSSPSQKWIDVFLGSTKVWVTDQVISTERHLVEMERETAGAAAKSEGHGGGSSDGEDDDSGGGASEGAMCLRPTVDIQEWISLLQDSPLLMVGDKFLEQEYLTIECMLLGAQDALEQRVEAVRVEPATEKDKEEESKGTATKADEEEGGQSRDNDDEDDDEPIQVEKRGSSDNGQSPLPFKIESEMPPFVELKVRPSSVSSLTPGSSAITSEGNEDGTKGGQARSKIYRKAKPGVMKLIDRVSNLTLVTFVRSDLLWDPQLEAEDDDQDESSASEEGVEEQGDAQDESAPYSDHSPLKKNSHRDGKEGATKGAKGKKGSFHPDCQWIESVLMCEPSSRVSHEILERLKEERQSAKDASTTPTIQEQGQQSKNSAATMESWLGSDFDHEMIRLCWIDELKQLAEPDARSADISDPQQDEPFSSSSAVDTGAARTPTVVFSYGYHWRQRPRLVDRYLFDTSSKTSPQRFQHNDYHLEDSGGNKGSDGSASARRRSSLLPRDDNSGGTSSINFISRLQLISLLSFTSTKHNREREMQFVEERRRRREALRIGYATMLHKSVQYVTDNYPESHIIVQTSLERRHWEDDEQHGEKEKVESEAPANAMDHSKRSSTLDARKGRKSCSTRELTRQEMLSVEDDDIALTAISKNVVKSFQDPAVTLLDTYFLSQWTPDQSPEAVATSGPLDAMVEMIYGEQFRQRYNDEQEDADEL